MALARALVHTAALIRTVSEPSFEEGEPEDDETEEVATFPCFLIIPLGTEADAPRGRRKVTVPTVLFDALDAAGRPQDVHAEDTLEITAPELPAPNGGPDPVTWQVVGEPQPFQKPGTLKGFQATLRRVED